MGVVHTLQAGSWEVCLMVWLLHTSTEHGQSLGFQGPANSAVPLYRANYFTTVIQFLHLKNETKDTCLCCEDGIG